MFKQGKYYYYVVFQRGNATVNADSEDKAVTYCKEKDLMTKYGDIIKISCIDKGVNDEEK